MDRANRPAGSPTIGAQPNRRAVLARAGGLAAGAGAIVSLARCGGPGSTAPNPAAAGCQTKIEVWAEGIGGDTMTQLIADFTAKNAACSIEAIQRAEFAQFGFYVPVSIQFPLIDEAIAGKRSVRDALDAIHRDAVTKYDEYKTRFKTQKAS